MSERTRKSGKEDLRQRRSKRHLSEALVSLMEERPLREISVVDICERAMVHRTTFYAHFEDKNDLPRSERRPCGNGASGRACSPSCE